MGYIILELGSVWNIMFCYIYECCMEVYVYFDMEEDMWIFYMMGKLDEMKYLVMSNE